MNETIIKCPHCGFTDYDEMEICQACGYLSEDTPVRDISFSQVVNDARTRLRQMGFRGDTEDLSDSSLDPAFSSIPGNIFYNLYNDEP